MYVGVCVDVNVLGRVCRHVYVYVDVCVYTHAYVCLSVSVYECAYKHVYVTPVRPKRSADTLRKLGIFRVSSQSPCGSFGPERSESGLLGVSGMG